MTNGHTVICGLERIGLRVARALLQLGERVTIVTARTPDPSLLSEARAAGAHVLNGRTVDITNIDDAHIGSARCLVLTEDTDLGNLQAALAAREANPSIRVVLRMFNVDLADRATRLLANSQLVSTSAEAAPYFAAHALGLAHVPTRVVWGRHLVIDPFVGDEATPRPPRPASRGRGLGSLPPAPHPVDLGEGEFLHPIEPPEHPAHRRRAPRRHRIRNVLLPFLSARLGVAMLIFASLIGLTTVVFHLAPWQGLDGRPVSLGWLDALDLTLSAAFGNYTVTAAADWVKVYVACFTFSAALSVALVYALVTDAVVGTRILESLGVPRGRMRNHVIVLGLGSVGIRIVQHLLEMGVRVAAADSQPNGRFVAIARSSGVPVVISSGRYAEALPTLSAAQARAVIAASPDDLVNLEASLTAREMNPDARVVTRIFDQDLAERAQAQLHITACESVSALATPAFVAAALGDGVLSTIERGNQLWLLVEARVGVDSWCHGVRIEDLEAESGARVLALRDVDGAHWRPHLPARLQPGHDVLAACSRESWQRLLEVTAPR